MPMLSRHLHNPLVPRRRPASPSVDSHRRDHRMEPDCPDVGDFQCGSGRSRRHDAWSEEEVAEASADAAKGTECVGEFHVWEEVGMGCGGRGGGMEGREFVVGHDGVAVLGD